MNRKFSMNVSTNGTAHFHDVPRAIFDQILIAPETSRIQHYEYPPRDERIYEKVAVIEDCTLIFFCYEAPTKEEPTEITLESIGELPF